jgi:predicted regulator of Ras-like GTPase activity (Roadblock/LC7/MglB family)
MFDFLKRLFSPPAPLPPLSVPAVAKPDAPPPNVVPPVPASLIPFPRQPEGDAIPVPLSDIVARLPGALAPLISGAVTGVFPLPVKTALGQLPSGAVRIPFGQIRQSAPPGTFANNTGFDETLVELPLARILAAMNPALLARRIGQTRVEVPAEISGIFGAKDKGLPVAPSAPSAVRAAPPPPAAPAPAPVLPPTPAVPVPVPMPQPAGGDTLPVPLSALYEFWAEPVRQDITRANWNNASVRLPMNRLDSSMKTGRVVFTWGELMQWLDVPASSFVSLHRETVLELPLKVIAPLFMSRRRTPVVQKKIAVGDNIPNLFAGLGKPSPPPVPVPVPEVVPPVFAASSVPANVLGEIFGQPDKREWSPQEITQKINALPGVAACLLAMSDGLLVAGELPPPLKSETMAAFLPQIFGRLAHYSGEIQLGPLTALTMLSGQTPCMIFKTGALYLAVLGKYGAPLPQALLQRVAGELAKRNS